MSEDPTRIDIETDPTTCRMRGIAHHGRTPFDVPYISQIAPGLWQGGCADGLVLPDFIGALVSLYPWERYTVEHEILVATTVRMYDSLDQATDLVDGLAAWVLALWKGGISVLVHCQAGLNRSSLVVARALMLDGLTADEAIGILREQRSPACLCNPAFEAWLRERG